MIQLTYHIQLFYSNVRLDFSKLPLNAYSKALANVMRFDWMMSRICDRILQYNKGNSTSLVTLLVTGQHRGLTSLIKLTF